MMILLIFLSFFCHWTHSCVPTSPAAMPPIPCVSCDAALVTVAPGFTSDSGVIANGCHTRTLFCMAEAYFLLSYGSGVIPGPATIVLTCNAANTAWMYNGAMITQASCSQCQSCPNSLIVVPPPYSFGSDDMTTVVNGCNERTLTCMGTNTDTYIQYNNAAGSIPGAGGTAMMTVTCNAAGSAWLYSGTPITQAECRKSKSLIYNYCTLSSECQECPPSGLTLSDDLLSMWGETTSVASGCSVRAMVCSSPTMPPPPLQCIFIRKWQSGAFMGDIPDASDGTGDGMAIMDATCNAAGTAWSIPSPTGALVVDRLSCCYLCVGSSGPSICYP